MMLGCSLPGPFPDKDLQCYTRLASYVRKWYQNSDHGVALTDGWVLMAIFLRVRRQKKSGEKRHGTAQHAPPRHRTQSGINERDEVGINKKRRRERPFRIPEHELALGEFLLSARGWGPKTSKNAVSLRHCRRPVRCFRRPFEQRQRQFRHFRFDSILL